ncbi:hypothetical protein M8J76_015636 [Diaphorina citri]|nr:hypothetical protein M8J76_015636 [Diaphorina citri]KAI5756030.1 hypothetical protein M8J77_021510 [Diaphorina citri]
MSNCESAKSQGVVVLHGSRNSFLNHIIPPFSVIFQAFQEYQLNQDATEQLFQSLQAYLGETKLAKCGSNYENIYLKQMRSVIQPWVV